jgi:hypothetical protein
LWPSIFPDREPRSREDRDSNRDQDIALEDMQHCHAGLVRAEDGFIAKTVDTSRFAASAGSTENIV